MIQKCLGCMHFGACVAVFSEKTGQSKQGIRFFLPEMGYNGSWGKKCYCFLLTIYVMIKTSMSLGTRGGDDMKDEESLKNRVDADIFRCQEVWKEYSHDKDVLGVLFDDLLARYANVIDGFVDEMRVIFASENSPQMAKVYRENVQLMLQRLLEFQENGYTNEGLEDLRIRKELGESVSIEMDFGKIRMELGLMEGISTVEREDIMARLGEMEEICSLSLTRRKKWDLLRKYVLWVSGKEVEIAMRILPLFLKINER